MESYKVIYELLRDWLVIVTCFDSRSYIVICSATYHRLCDA